MFYFTISKILNSQRTALEMVFLRSKGFGGQYGFQSAKKANTYQRVALEKTKESESSGCTAPGWKQSPSGTSLTLSQDFIFLEFWSKCAHFPVYFIFLSSLWCRQIPKIVSWHNLALMKPMKISVTRGYPTFLKDTFCNFFLFISFPKPYSKMICQPALP